MPAVVRPLKHPHLAAKHPHHRGLISTLAATVSVVCERPRAEALQRVALAPTVRAGVLVCSQQPAPPQITRSASCCHTPSVLTKQRACTLASPLPPSFAALCRQQWPLGCRLDYDVHLLGSFSLTEQVEMLVRRCCCIQTTGLCSEPLSSLHGRDATPCASLYIRSTTLP